MTQLEPYLSPRSNRCLSACFYYCPCWCQDCPDYRQAPSPKTRDVLRDHMNISVGSKPQQHIDPFQPMISWGKKIRFHTQKIWILSNFSWKARSGSSGLTFLSTTVHPLCSWHVWCMQLQWGNVTRLVPLEAGIRNPWRKCARSPGVPRTAWEGYGGLLGEDFCVFVFVFNSEA